MNKDQAKILFEKYNNNECSNEEIDLLNSFLDSYQGKTIDSSNIVYAQERKEKIWNTIIASIEPQLIPKKANYFRSNSFYAIAATLVLFFGISIFLVNNTEKTTTSTNKINQPIIVGSDKAFLTLENGETIALEKGKSFANKNVNSNGESLVYAQKDSDEKLKTSYNFITIPRGGQFFVQLADGTKVWLNSESKLKFPVTFQDQDSRTVELIYGEAYFDVSSSKNHNGTTFIVKTKEQKIEVLGTEFNIKAYQDEKSLYTTLVEGKIAFGYKNTNRLLSPNEQIVLNLDNEKITSPKVDVHNEVAWKDGIFSFKGKNLKEIMKVLSRWYDVEVVFENKSIESLSFKGVLGKDQSIEEILSAIKSASIINSYQIKNKTIYLK